MLLELFEQHNEQIKALIDQDYAPATLTRYAASLKHTKVFLQWKYKQTDIDIKKPDFEFITEYEFWLKSIRKCNHNSTMKYIGNLKKITNSDAVKNFPSSPLACLSYFIKNAEKSISCGFFISHPH